MNFIHTTKKTKINMKLTSLYLGKVETFYLDGLMHICHYRDVIGCFNLLKYLRIKHNKIKEGKSFN